MRFASPVLASPIVASRLVTAVLALVLPAGCAGDADPTPDEHVAVAADDLAFAELPADLAAAAPVALADGELALAGSTRFAPDATLAEDGDATALLGLHAAPGPVDRSAREVIVAVRWGYFPPRAADAWVDWSGFVAVSRGEIEVLSALRFEHEADGEARPHEDFAHRGPEGRLVRFRSSTRPAWDGLLLRIKRPTLGPSVVVFKVGPVTRVLAFEELFDLAAAEPVGPAGHELRLTARAVPAAHPCVMAVAPAHGEWHGVGGALGLFAGAIAAPAGPIAFAGATLDVRGPYGRWRGQLRRPGTGELLGGARGIFAQFHYAPGGTMTGAVVDADLEQKGGLVGRHAGGMFDAVLLHKDPACGDDDAAAE